MKTKKILTMISAVAMAATLGVSSLAGCNKGGHTHSYNWVTDYEATCTLPGQRTGTCVCGNVKAEVIPVNPDAHDFDMDWAITKPTESGTGSATRTCKYNSAHTFNVTLPGLSDTSEYLSAEITKKPTIIEAGTRHYVFSHMAGDIEFDISLPKREKIENVEDVALYAWSLHNNIRRSDGNYVEGDPDGTDVRAHEFYNYYGGDYGKENTYTRVHDGGNMRDFWYSRDEKGNPFGISAVKELEVTNPPEDPANPPAGWEPIMGEVNRDPRVDESVTESDLLGYGYMSGGGMPVTYGAEDTLRTYYEASQSQGAIKYDDTFTANADGSYVCAFEFSRMEATHFCRYYVNFTTYTTGEIKTLSVRTKIIRRFMLASTFDGTNTGELVFDEDGDAIFSEIYPIGGDGSERYETNYVYETDASGKVIYDPVYVYEKDPRDDTGTRLLYDEEGDPIISKDEHGDPITEKNPDGSVKTEPRKKYNYQMTYKYVYQTDASGNPVIGEDGEPVIKTDADGNPLYEKDADGNAILVYAKDVYGAKIKTPIVGDPPIATEGVKTKPDGTPLLDRFGNQIARPVPEGGFGSDKRYYYYEAGDPNPDGGFYTADHEYIVTRWIEFNQTLKVEGEKADENPYPADSVYIRSFDVTYNGKVIPETDTVEISASTPALFRITNVQPSETAKLEFDPLRVFLKTASGEIELSYTGDVDDFNQNSYHIIGYFRNSDNSVYVNAQYAGEMTLILRTRSGKCERELKLRVARGVPTALIAQAYMYSDADGTESYTWTETEYKYGDPKTAITLYEGQTLYVRGIATPAEANYVDATFVTELEIPEDSQYIKLEDNLELPDGTKVSKITALAATPDFEVGINVNSVHTTLGGIPVAFKRVGVTVVAAPSTNDMFTGTYKGRFSFINMIVSGAPVPADVTVTFNPSSSTAGTMNIDVTEGNNKETCVYSYTYDAQTRNFTATYVSGRNDATFQFTFALNEAYKLTIHHLTIPERDRSETIVLSRPQ